MDLVSHKVRTKLDELKRMEIEYQRRLRKQERDHLNGINERNFWSPVFDENSETFETEDLKKLLHKVHSLLLQKVAFFGNAIPKICTLIPQGHSFLLFNARDVLFCPGLNSCSSFLQKSTIRNSKCLLCHSFLVLSFADIEVPVLWLNLHDNS